MNTEKHKKYIGADNTLILENLKRLQNAGADIIVRIPVISGVNDSESEMRAIAERLKEGGKMPQVELLPYHAMGENKYGALAMRAQCFSPPDAKRLEALKELFIQ